MRLNVFRGRFYVVTSTLHFGRKFKLGLRKLNKSLRFTIKMRYFD